MRDRELHTYSIQPGLDPRPGFAFIACLICALVVSAVAASVTQAQPFDELHCYRLKDSQAQEAAITLLRESQEVPETCEIKGRATRACVAVRSTLKGEKKTSVASDGSILFDRLCYKVDCADETAADETIVTDRFGEHELQLRESRLVCLPAALGDLDELIARSDPDAAKRAIEKSGGLSPDVDLATCGDHNSTGTITASDALGVLQTAVGSGVCLPCVCDVDMSGAFTATDALAVLQFAVGLLGNLNCPPDANPVTWDGGGDGVSWSDPLNWSMNTRIPNGCDDVTIPTGAVVTVEHDSGSNAALRVTSELPLELSGGTLTLRDTIQVNNAFRITGGALADATVLASGVPLKTEQTVDGTIGEGITFTSFAGVLDGVTCNAPMNLSASGAYTFIENGLTLNDTATLGTTGQMIFRGASNTLTGNAEIVFASASFGYVTQQGTSDLIIDSDVTIHGMAGQVGGTSAGSTMTNNGTIHSDAPGIIDIRGPGGWTNNGTLIASGGNIRTFESWMNNGAIEVGAGNRLDANTGLTLTSASELTVDIASMTDYGVFNVTGNASLDGTLTINLTNSFDPGLGESFVIMTYATQSGGFDTINGLAIGGGKEFSVDIGATDITLTVVAS